MMRFYNTLKFHLPLLGVLLLYMGLALFFTTVTPLGEAPDEPAQFQYAQFLAQSGRLPANLADRQAAGYRSTWPPLYHLLVAGVIHAVGDQPPTELKAVGDTARRLIPTNGQTIAAIIHTEDESWPWQGITLAWHLGRLISSALSALAIMVTYLIAWRLTHRRWLATAAAATHAFLPQFLFTSTVISDDSLLILLTGLITLFLVILTQQEAWPRIWQLVTLGAMLGLATVTKYNALPFWGIVGLWVVWLTIQRGDRYGRQFLGALGAIGLGVVLTAGWWFWFVWQNFNQIAEHGWIAGSLMALSAGTADASLRQLGNGGGIAVPPPVAWAAWAGQMFRTFWGVFGGGGTIEFPGWVYGVLALITPAAVAGLFIGRRAPQSIFLLVPLFMLPLPVLRFMLSNNPVETAQGRHLFPALAMIAFGLVWGLAQIGAMGKRNTGQDRPFILPALFVILLVGLSLVALSRIDASYPPPIPLRTTVDPEAAASSLYVLAAPEIALTGIQPVASDDSPEMVTVNLHWEATSTPRADYLVKIEVTGDKGELYGGWLGHPIGGRYPTRAWDEGDQLVDAIPVLLRIEGSSHPLTINVTLVDNTDAAVGDSGQVAFIPPKGDEVTTAATPAILRADQLAPDAPFSYRGTISLPLADGGGAPVLVAPDGNLLLPAWVVPGAAAHYIVAADWLSGEYEIRPGTSVSAGHVTVVNRPRQFSAPTMARIVDANFADAITLLGYDLPHNVVQPGESFPLTLYMRANRTMGKSLTIFNHLLDAAAVQQGGADRIPKQYYTTLLWVPGEIVSDSYQVPVAAGAPPGIYWLDVGFYVTDHPDQSLPLIVDGQPIARNSVSIGPIKVGGPPPGLTTNNVNPEYRVNASFGDQIVLLGYDITATVEGQASDITLYWQATATPQRDYTVFMHLLDDAGNLAAQADGPPAAGRYPTTLWGAGEIVIDWRPLPASPQVEKMLVGLYDPDTGHRLPTAQFADGAVPLPVVIGKDQ
jgi:hypothetical protein